MINTLLLKRDLFHFLDQLALNADSMVFVPMLKGGFWLLQDPELVRQVLIADEKMIGKPEFLLQSNRGNYGDGLTSLSAEQWQARRTASVRAYTPDVLARMVANTHTATLKMMAQLPQNEPLALPDELLKLVTRIGAQWILSTCVEDGANGAAIPWAEAAGIWHELDLPDEASALMPSRRLRAGATPVMRTIIREKWGAEPNCGPSDFIGSFYASCQEQGLQLNEQEVFDEIVQLLFAAHHTVTTTLVNCIAFLHRYPEIKERVVQCAQANRKLANDSADTTKHQKYTEYFIKEAMRFCMPTTLLFRQVRLPLRLADHSLRQDDLIVISPYLLHRDARWFSEPLRFNPERFRDSNYGYAYLPFGAGKRRCVAHRLALMQIKGIIETLVLGCELIPLSTTPDNLFSVSYPGPDYNVMIKPASY
ncbi:cytochrome P450 [Iodobacter arcticus]|uniref:Cytochrome P450 n=1 Tax=Iodobacter arcticus TaxID=590593 RepID=A0ABW2QXY5_9NEIS